MDGFFGAQCRPRYYYRQGCSYVVLRYLDYSTSRSILNFFSSRRAIHCTYGVKFDGRSRHSRQISPPRPPPSVIPCAILTNVKCGCYVTRLYEREQWHELRLFYFMTRQRAAAFAAATAFRMGRAIYDSVILYTILQRKQEA